MYICTSQLHCFFSGELKCGVFSEWFEPFVKDWIDEITHTVKQEISIIFEDCDFEQSVKQVNVSSWNCVVIACSE